MRKLILSAILVASSATMFAQKLDAVKEKIDSKKYDEAKKEIDKILADPKGQKNANAWFYKGIVYTNLGMDSTKTDMDYKGEAFNAFKKYYELDPKNVMGTLDQNVRMFQLYEGYYTQAVKDYNANNFAGSFNNFKNVLAVEEYISQKGFTYTGINIPAFDTALHLNIAATASKAKMEDSAMVYYQRLADKKIKGENYIEIYQLLVDYYIKKGDEANKAKYLALGRELYPESDYWFEAELSPVREDKAKLFAKYQELTKANPTNYYLNYNYAVELFNYVYAGDKKPADAATYDPMVEVAIANAVKANSTPDANLLMVRYLSEQVYKLEDQSRAIKGATPDAVKKRKDLAASVNKTWDKLVPYAETSFTGYTGKKDLKAYEKGNLKFVSNVLIDYYNMKKQFDKAKSYEDKVKEFGI
ncbi:hypothetical protein OCK74_08645 [Chitinophagaceae bacterium LB-8]|uniref:Tetratricopeptide repeat protein n=1 Tax=Paraflavisolibacter caeni TaxID=2982496 RepID=A0A9X2XV84_9BACT|nr:hypothetical protein [Paraflavisolibacter caeni]MCU7549181.1 hypothetical protein [Paraflavisolibacter caeni]